MQPPNRDTYGTSVHAHVDANGSPAECDADCSPDAASYKHEHTDRNGYLVTDCGPDCSCLDVDTVDYAHVTPRDLDANSGPVQFVTDRHGDLVESAHCCADCGNCRCLDDDCACG